MVRETGFERKIDDMMRQTTYAEPFKERRNDLEGVEGSLRSRCSQRMKFTNGDVIIRYYVSGLIIEQQVYIASAHTAIFFNF